MSKLDQAFHFHTQVLSLRTERQALIASNIANADTPNYKARDFEFGEELQRALGARGMSGSGGLSMAQSNVRHIDTAHGQAGARYQYRTETQSSVDGNTVDMDVERAQFTDNAIRYEASVNFVSSRFRGLLDAMRSHNA